MKDFLKNLLLITISFTVCLAAAELILRQTSLSAFSLNRGYLFMSEPSFVRVGDSAVGYAPNAKVREVAVFGKHVEYDVIYHTNNLGMVDDVDYVSTGPEVKDIVYLGDSFTAGVGVNTPWVSMLRKAIGSEGLAFYSFGVSGIGIPQFRQLLNEYKEKISYDVVNVMAITNDFFRKEWFPMVGDGGIRFCPDGVTDKDCMRSQKPKIFNIDSDTPRSEILARARNQYLQANIDKDSNRTPLQRLRLFNVYCDAMYRATESLVAIPEICPQWRLYKTLRYKKNETYESSLDTLKKMQADFPNVKFRLFHVPQKGDVYAKKYAVDIGDDVKAIGMDYIPLLTECDWSMPMYNNNDGHPNSSGYVNLARCMGEYLN